MKRLLFLCPLLALFGASCASQRNLARTENQGPHVICHVGNEQATPGPDFRGFPQKPGSSSTEVTFLLGDIWKEQGLAILTDTKYFQYGVASPKYSVPVLLSQEAINDELLRTTLDSIGFQVIATLDPRTKSVDFQFALYHTDLPVNLRDSTGSIANMKKILVTVPEAQFGSSTVVIRPAGFGDVKILCTGHF